MLIGAFFSWWYGRGFLGVAQSFQPRLQSVLSTFSVGQLLQTLFAPWRRIITYPGASFDQKMRALADNAFSRCIGFVIRFFVLLGAGIAIVFVLLATLVELIIWPLLPVAIPGSLIVGALL